MKFLDGVGLMTRSMVSLLLTLYCNQNWRKLSAFSNSAPVPGLSNIKQQVFFCVLAKDPSGFVCYVTYILILVCITPYISMNIDGKNRKIYRWYCFDVKF